MHTYTHRDSHTYSFEYTHSHTHTHALTETHRITHTTFIHIQPYVLLTPNYSHTERERERNRLRQTDRQADKRKEENVLDTPRQPNPLPQAWFLASSLGLLPMVICVWDSYWVEMEAPGWHFWEGVFELLLSLWVLARLRTLCAKFPSWCRQGGMHEGGQRGTKNPDLALGDLIASPHSLHIYGWAQCQLLNFSDFTQCV